MSLIISRVIFSAIVLGMAYYAFLKIWTMPVDVMRLLKRPSDAIPVAKTPMPSELSVGLRFPYETVEGEPRLNRRNPIVEITNRGSHDVSPMRVSVKMFVITDTLEQVMSAAIFSDPKHGRLIFEPELKPGKSVGASLPGVKDWVRSAVYRVEIGGHTLEGHSVPALTIHILVSKNDVKIQFKGLSNEELEKIKSSIADFENNEDAREVLSVDAVTDNAWVARPLQNAEATLNDDGTLSVRRPNPESSE